MGLIKFLKLRNGKNARLISKIKFSIQACYFNPKEVILNDLNLDLGLVKTILS
ncbi:MAG: hypothetical protein ACJAW3_000645 [Lentimonas sp.]|jgi:hypothetical protein